MTCKCGNLKEIVCDIKASIGVFCGNCQVANALQLLYRIRNDNYQFFLGKTLESFSLLPNPLPKGKIPVCKRMRQIIFSDLCSEHFHEWKISKFHRERMEKQLEEFVEDFGVDYESVEVSKCLEIVKMKLAKNYNNASPEVTQLIQNLITRIELSI